MTYSSLKDALMAKELDVKKGERVEGNIELNGWLWCNRLNVTEEGWLPKEKLLV